MRAVKSLIVIALLFAFSNVRGQGNDVLLEKIDFSDTTLIDSDFMRMTIAEYIDSSQTPDMSERDRMYSMILAADNILGRCVSSFPMYRFVYQYLIYGFSELGLNSVIDYMIHVPYLAVLNADEEQRAEIINLAMSYERVKIESKAPDIQAVTINRRDFKLYDIDAEYTIILFWSYSCPHCRDLIAELSDFFGKDKSFAVVTVNVSGDLKKVKRLLKKNRLVEYAVCDGKGWESPIVDDYAVDMTPSMFLLDKEKKILAKPFDFEELIKEIER